MPVLQQVVWLLSPEAGPVGKSFPPRWTRCTLRGKRKISVKYLFDTDTLSSLFKPHPPEGLKDRIAAVPIHDQCISTLSILEITFGAYKSDNPEKYLDFLERMVLPRVRVLSFDDTAARMAGKIRADREKIGMPIAPVDLQIAATARANGCILITGNVSHFASIPGLEVENWIRD
jgi:tRNA(fMet)-specific endonuclease VapC